jgi:hypothetical protein
MWRPCKNYTNWPDASFRVYVITEEAFRLIPSRHKIYYVSRTFMIYGIPLEYSFVICCNSDSQRDTRNTYGSTRITLVEISIVAVIIITHYDTLIGQCDLFLH